MFTRNATHTESASDHPSPAAISPPPKRSRKSVCKYSIVHLKENRGYQYFQDKASSDSFVAAFHDIVEEVKGYSSKKEFLEAKTQYETDATVAKIASRTTEQPPRQNEEQANLARNILESMNHQGTANIDTISTYVLTGTWYTKACIVIRFLDSNAKEHWCWKPTAMTGVLSNYFRSKPCNIPYVQEALAQLTHTPLPDPSDPMGQTQAIYSYTANSSAGEKTIEIPLFVAYTFLEIPIDTLTSQEDETSWLLNQTRTLINQLKIAMATEAFNVVMFNLNQNYAAKIFRPNKQGNNLLGFLHRAVVKVNMVDSLLPYVIRPGWDTIEKVFLDTLHSYEKYKTRPIQPEDADDDDDDTDVTNASTFQDSIST
jgi:hypothetical protein